MFNIIETSIIFLVYAILVSNKILSVCLITDVSIPFQHTLNKYLLILLFL